MFKEVENTIKTWRKRIKALGLKQYEVAEKLDVTTTSVNRWCAGCVPSRRNFEKVERYLRKLEQ